MSISKSEPAGRNSCSLHDLPSKETLVLKWKFNISRQSGDIKGHLHTKGAETRLSPEFSCNFLTLVLVQRGLSSSFLFSGTKRSTDESTMSRKRKRKEGSPLLEMPDLPPTQKIPSQTSPSSSDVPDLQLDSLEVCPKFLWCFSGTLC